MLILVSDANILIDIEIGDLTVPMFSLNYQFITPDILYYEELEEHHPHLKSMGLGIREMDEGLITQVDILVSKYPKTSRNDIFALVLADHVSCPLLSGDKALRVAASHESVECRGTLWLIRELLEQKKITPQTARAALQKMKARQSRLPWDEAEQIISEFD